MRAFLNVLSISTLGLFDGRIVKASTKTLAISCALLIASIGANTDLVAQSIHRTVVASAAPAEGLTLPTPNQRSSFRDSSGNSYTFFASSTASGAQCEVGLYKSVDDGLSWAQITAIPDIGEFDCQVDVSAELASDQCSLHLIWTVKRKYSSNQSRLGYAVYDICADNWLMLEAVRPGVPGLSPDLTLYRKAGQDLPIIGYITSLAGLNQSWINLKTNPSTWLYPQSVDAIQSADADFFLGNSLQLSNSGGLKLFGSVRAPGGLCDSETHMFAREIDASNFLSPPPSYLVHGYAANHQSFYKDDAGNIWINYIAFKDAGCSPGQGIYTLRLPVTGALVNVYTVGDMETGPPADTIINGRDHFNFGVTSVGGNPVTLFTRFEDNYEKIYKATWNGNDFAAPQVIYEQAGEQYLSLQTYKTDLPCLQFSAISQSAAGKEAVVFSECSPVSKIAPTATGPDITIGPDYLGWNFKMELQDVSVYDLSGRLILSALSKEEWQTNNWTPKLSAGVFIYQANFADGSIVSGKILSIK